MKHQNIPGPDGAEREADRLIAAFGKKQTPEKREELLGFLKGQKERFLKQDRERQRDGHERGV